MLKYLHQNGEKGQTIVLLAFAMIGLLGMVGLALDGGMLYWNQRRAQNGADAAVVAGVTILIEHAVLDAGCGAESEQQMLDVIWEYAGLNEVPDPDAGENVEAFYLVENGSGDRVDLINPGTNKPWQVGETGTIPCAQNPVGLRVEASFPQRTFLAHVVGIASTNVTVEASAVYDSFNACDAYALLALGDDPGRNVLTVTGSDITIEGAGSHSNGGSKYSGGGHGIDFEPPGTYPAECGEDAACQFDKVNGTSYSGPADPVSLGEAFYRFEDFENPTGYIWQEATLKYEIFGNLDSESQYVQDGKPKSGLYVVYGDVQINSLPAREPEDPPWRLTIAATGSIKFSGGENVRPYARGVLFFTESSDTTNGAVQLSGSDNSWAGMIIALNGLVNISGANNNDFSGMIFGKEVSISGSNNTFKHHPNYCPPDPPQVLLVQ
jgi:hypothetical protein